MPADETGAEWEGWKNWKGCWVGESWQTDIASRYNSFFAFRKAYVLDRKPSGGTLSISADSRYKLWVNGRFVARGPARCFPWHQSFDTLAIGDYLQEGENWFAVLVHQFGISTYQYVHRIRTGLIVDGEITFQNGEVVPICTDTSWDVRKADWYIESAIRQTLCLGFQERCDLSKEEKNWQTGFLDCSREAWHKAYYLGRAGVSPWTDMEERGIPQLEEEVVPGMILAAMLSGRQNCAAERESLTAAIGNIRFAVQEVVDSAAILPEPGKVDDDGWLQLDEKFAAGGVLVIDFGHVTAAFPRVEIRDNHASVQVLSACSTTIGRDGLPILNDGFGTEFEGSAQEVVFPPEGSEWESYSLIGYQYHIAVVQAPCSCSIRITANRAGYPVQVDPQLHFSDPLLKRITRISLTTLSSVMLDAYTDNSWREQAQWIQDGVSMARSAFYLFGDVLLLKRALRQWSYAQLPSGILNSVSPQEPTFMQLVDYSLVWVEGLDFYYGQSGDIEFISDMMPTVERLFGFIKHGVTDERLYAAPEDAQMLIDWTEIDRRPYSLTLNLLVVSALEKSAVLAEAVSVAYERDSGRLIQHSEKYRTLAGKLRKECTDRFWDDRNACWIERIEPRGDIMNEYRLRRQPGGWANISDPAETELQHSQHGNAMALLLKLGSVKQQAWAAGYLARCWSSSCGKRNVPSPMWVDKVFSAMAENVPSDQFFAALDACFGPEAAPDRTTWPEQFGIGTGADSDIPACGSSGQGAASSIMYVLYRHVLGLSAAKPGWDLFELNITDGQMQEASGSVRTLRGTISIIWKRREGKLDIDLQIPEGVSCRVKPAAIVLGPGKHTFSIPAGSVRERKSWQ